MTLKELVNVLPNFAKLQLMEHKGKGKGKSTTELTKYYPCDLKTNHETLVSSKVKYFYVENDIYYLEIAENE